MLRKGFMGGYAYRRMQVSAERYTSVPDKNQYSHPMDALTYTSARLFGGALRTPKSRHQEYYEPLLTNSTRSGVTGY